MTDAKAAAERILGSDDGGASTGYFDSHDPAIVARAYLEAESLFKAELADACKEYREQFERAERAEARIAALRTALKAGLPSDSSLDLAWEVQARAALAADDEAVKGA